MSADEHDDVRGDLRSALERIQRLEQELDQAKTARERHNVRTEIEEERDDLGALAKQAGIPRSRIEEAVRNARQAEDKERLRPVIAELLAEQKAAEEAAADDDDGDDPDEDEEKPARKPRRRAVAAAGDGAAPDREGDDHSPAPSRRPDSEPVNEHWSEKTLGDLLR